MYIKINEKEQAVAPNTIRIDYKAFEKTNATSIFYILDGKCKYDDK